MDRKRTSKLNDWSNLPLNSPYKSAETMRRRFRLRNSSRNWRAGDRGRDYGKQLKYVVADAVAVDRVSTPEFPANGE